MTGTTDGLIFQPGRQEEFLIPTARTEGGRKAFLCRAEAGLDSNTTNCAVCGANGSRFEARTKLLSKLEFNGVGGTQTYLSFAHLEVPSFSKQRSAETFN